MFGCVGGACVGRYALLDSTLFCINVWDACGYAETHVFLSSAKLNRSCAGDKWNGMKAAGTNGSLLLSYSALPIRLEDPSPLTWTSLTRERKRVFYSKTETRDWCLQQALEEGRANGHFFFRKVGRLGMSEGESDIKRKQDEEGGEKDEVVRLCELLYGVWDKGRGEKGNVEGEERGREVRRTEKRRRYHLRLPTKLCVGETCGRSRGNESREWKGEKEEVDEMEVRAKRLEALSKGRR